MTVIPVVYDLLPRTPYTMLVPGDNFYWASPVTSHIWVLDPSQGPAPEVAYARMRVLSTVVASNSALFRLATFDSGPVNPRPLTWLANSHPDGSTISSDAVDFTGALQGVVNAGVWKQIGWQMAGDNTHAVVIYNVRLEIGWRVG